MKQEDVYLIVKACEALKEMYFNCYVYKTTDPEVINKYIDNLKNKIDDLRAKDN